MPSLRKTLACVYRYDALDRLIGHAQTDAPLLERFYCKSRLATEIQGAAQHSIVQHDDLLLAQQRRQANALDTTLLATDQQRSVLCTLNASLRLHPIAYSPYGHYPTGNGLMSLLGFNGERPDPVTGHYLLGNGYRAFNPVLMRFNSPDSFSPFGYGGLNSYTYSLGDPINRSDPNGHISTLGITSVFNASKNYAARLFNPSSPKNKINTGVQQQDLSTYKKLENSWDERIAKEYQSYNEVQASHSEPLIKTITKLSDFKPQHKYSNFNFVFTEDGQLLVAADWQMSHASGKQYVPSASHAVIAHFAKSHNIISAGYIDAKLLPKIKINPRSGHFLPDDETLQPVAAFLRNINASVQIRGWGSRPYFVAPWT